MSAYKLSFFTGLTLSFSMVGAIAGPYQNMFVFGDSYSDTGYGYVDGNGPTSVAYLAQDMGISFTYAGAPNSSGKGLNFAVSGAQTGFGTGFEVAPGQVLGYGMLNQVADFKQLVDHNDITFNPANTLFFIAGGLNDSSLPTSTTLSNITSQFQTLYDLGARSFQLALLPTDIPAFSVVGTRLDAAYRTLLPKLQSMFFDANISFSNWGLYYDKIITNPSSYGITNTTDACAGREIFGQDTTPCATPDTYFFYHDSHPSTAVHKIVGDLMYQDLVLAAIPEPSTGALMLGGIGFLGLVARRKVART